MLLKGEIEKKRPCDTGGSKIGLMFGSLAFLWLKRGCAAVLLQPQHATIASSICWGLDQRTSDPVLVFSYMYVRDIMGSRKARKKTEALRNRQEANPFITYQVPTTAECSY